MLQLLKSIPNVEGVILVGSGANGSPDKWADVDLSVVISPDEHTLETWQKIHRAIESTFHPIIAGRNVFEEQNYLSLIFLQDYLELDVGVLSLSKLIAKKPNWKILYDKSGKVEAKMRSTSPSPSALPSLSERAQSLFYHSKNTVVAIKRKRYFKAAKEIEDLRNKVLESWSAAHDYVSDHFRDVDDFPKELLQVLKDTYPEEVSSDELFVSLQRCIDLYEWCSQDVRSENTALVQTCRMMIKDFWDSEE